MTTNAEGLHAGYTIHNIVKLIPGGHSYFECLERMIDGARFTLHFQTYIFDADETGKRIGQSLIRASQRGVQVFLLIDGFASQHLPDSFIDELIVAGIRFRWFGPIFRNRYLYLGRRLHHKVVVADGSQCLIGGINISDRYNDMPGVPAWMDWALWAEGEVARTAFVVCAGRAVSRWMPWGQADVMVPPPMPVPVAKCAARIRINDWVLGKREISRSYLNVIRHASREIIIMSSYFMPGNEFRRNLRRAAARGVKVRIILTGVSDINLAKQAERYLYAWLLRNKIEVYEYTKTVLHGKMSCCDGLWLTVGSYNINDLSAKASVELNLEVMDKALADQARNMLQQIIASDCVKISEADERKSGWIKRLVHATAYTTFRLLLFVFTFYFRQQKP